jgi:hypothetical protein
VQPDKVDEWGDVLRALGSAAVLLTGLRSGQTVGMRITGVRLAPEGSPWLEVSVPRMALYSVLVLGLPLCVKRLRVAASRSASSDRERLATAVLVLYDVVQIVSLVSFLSRSLGRRSALHPALFLAGLGVVVAHRRYHTRSSEWEASAESLTAESASPPLPDDGIVRSHLLDAFRSLLSTAGSAIDWVAVSSFLSPILRSLTRFGQSAVGAAVLTLARTDNFSGVAQSLRPLLTRSDREELDALRGEERRCEPRTHEAVRALWDSAKTPEGREALAASRCPMCGGPCFDSVAYVGECGHPHCFSCVASAGMALREASSLDSAAAGSLVCGSCGEELHHLSRVF